MKMSDYPRTSDHPTVKYEIKDKIATLTLCTPENLNMVNEQFVDEFHKAILDLRYDDECRVIVVTSEGPTFFGSGDMVNLILGRMTQSELLARQFMQEDLDAVREFKNCGKPVIGCMDGMAMGGGCGYTLACDILFATPNAGFMPNVHAVCGLVPDCGGIYAMARLVGPQKAMWYSVRPEPVMAQEALEAGLVAKVFPDKEAMLEEAYKLAAFIAKFSPYGMQGIKNIAQHCDTWDFETYAMFEAENVANGVHTQDFKTLANTLAQGAADAAAAGKEFGAAEMTALLMDGPTPETYKGY